MALRLDPGGLVREARRRAGLSQRALASRAGTAQSVVARIEAGQTDPSTATLRKLLEAAGLELSTDLVPAPVPVEARLLAEVRRILAMTPAERVREVANVDRLARLARRA